MRPKASKFALAAALAIASLGSAANAQQQAAPAQAPERDWKLNKEERAALLAVEQALAANDTATAATALATAQGVAQGQDARYMLSTMQLRLGLATKNVQQQAAGIEGMIASGVPQGTQLTELYRNQAALASQSGDKAKAEAAYARLAAASPNDPTAAAMHAEARYDAGNARGSVELFNRAIALQAATGQPVAENWYKRALAIALAEKMVPETLTLTKQWIAAYPTPKNWRDSLIIYRQASLQPQGAAATAGDAQKAHRAVELDLLRLMRASKALSGERDYYELIDRLDQGGYPGEAQAVLNEGIAAKQIDSAKPEARERVAALRTRTQGDRASLAPLETRARSAANGAPALQAAEGYLGYGDYAKAAELYRLALQKGGVDANLVNTRLGMALALGGQKAEAQTVFQGISGPRAELASYWLIWLNRQA